VQYIDWHNKRFNESRFELFGINSELDLKSIILVPKEFLAGEVKCRIIYQKTIELIEFELYAFGQIRSLKTIIHDEIQYNYKYYDRSSINDLYSQRGDKDDILIIKKGMVSDSSYSNLVFSDGKNFHTPSSPLLKGTKRAKYISEGKIAEKDLTVKDIRKYGEIHLINAFLDLGRCVVPVNNIF